MTAQPMPLTLQTAATEARSSSDEARMNSTPTRRLRQRLRPYLHASLRSCWRLPLPLSPVPPRQLLHLPGLLATLLVCAASVAFAAPPAVPDPAAWSQLSPQQQAERRAAIREQLQSATPAERQAFRQALRQRLEQLSPQQREQLIGAQLERWQALTPKERERLQQERRERIQALSPDERRDMLRQRREILQKLSPEERAALRAPLPAPDAAPRAVGNPP